MKHQLTTMEHQFTFITIALLMFTCTINTVCAQKTYNVEPTDDIYTRSGDEPDLVRNIDYIHVKCGGGYDNPYTRIGFLKFNIKEITDSNESVESADDTDFMNLTHSGENNLLFI